MAMRFGVGIPTCREGTTYPVPYLRPDELAVVARRAEELGYHSLWANDHLTTPRVVRDTQPAPPNFYEALVTSAALAAVTRRLVFVLSVLVLPLREVVLLAKQVATLDVLSGGRLVLGVGIGNYREEFEAIRPALRGASRGAMLEEGIEALRRLFQERRASFDGRYVRFEDVELAPKPVQAPFPIHVSAHEPAGLRRIGRLGDGLIVAGLPPDGIAATWQAIDRAAREHGRDPARLSLHVQTWLSLAADPAAADAKLARSPYFRRLVALDPQRSEAGARARYAAGNLVGAPDDVVEQLRAFERAGISHLGIVFLGDTLAELLADMELFATRVRPAFPG